MIGKTTIERSIINHTAPTAFFNIFAHPITVSTVSPITFPTTGMNVETVAFAVLAVKPSTELLNVPSIDKVQTKIVSTIPKIHITADLINFDNLSI